jgi:signal transduction histidine kinase
MRQLLQNLIVNALKFHKKDEPPVVRVSGTLIRNNGANAERNVSHDESCQVTFEDNGIGFDEKYADRIFGVFQRLHGRNQYEGSGIGLSICKKIVERHGGTITAKSAPGKGTTFIITLPAKHKGEE